jgi:hypothetical protein
MAAIFFMLQYKNKTTDDTGNNDFQLESMKDFPRKNFSK